MCIKIPINKYKIRYCDTLNKTLKNINYDKIANFCIPIGENNDTWYSPEYDTENHSHMVLYSNNETRSQEIENMSAYNFPGEKWVTLPSYEMIIKTSFLVPIVILGVIGNLSLLYMIMRYSHLRTPTNMIIGNMALTDTLSLLIYPWTFLIVDFFQNFQLGEFGCKVEGWIECTLMIVNVINLSTISYDRLSAIVLPTQTRLTSRGARIIIITSWISSLSINCPLVIYRKYKQRIWKDFLEIYCTEDTKILSVYWLSLLAMLVWVPLIIMIICYTAILIKLDRYEQQVLKRENPICINYKTKVAKILFVIVITFIICRMPITALIFQRNNWLKQHNQNQVLGTNTILWFVARYLMYVNAALDPLIYGLTNETFRRSFRKIPIIKLFFKPNKVVIKKRNNNICIIPNPKKCQVTEWKCDKWLNFDMKDTTLSDKHLTSNSSRIGSQNNLINQ